MNRRSFLSHLAAAAGAAPLAALGARLAAGAPVRVAGRDEAGYGPLVPAVDEATGLTLIHLPRGFRYTSFSWAGDPMGDGSLTPGLHDGMGAFDAGPGRIVLVRNHELGTGRAFSPVAYDAEGGAGGTTTIEFDWTHGTFLGARASLSGTMRNCAGGVTPSGSWLTCEETVAQTGVPHGYVFEVPADGTGNPRPLASMGRFSHEALCVDPRTGAVYETEDATSSGFYRFVPADRWHLARGGDLYMMAVKGRPKHSLQRDTTTGEQHDVSWVRIPEPDRRVPIDAGFVSQQGRAQGAAIFSRLEGCWWGNDRAYVVSTNGGPAGEGQVWEYDPAQETIRLLFQSPGADVLDSPDNVCVSPKGLIVLCEDGGGTQYVHGLTPDGRLFPLATNAVQLAGERNGLRGDFRGSEFAGACFSPDGKWLFLNVQNPGLTMAITGPW